MNEVREAALNAFLAWDAARQKVNAIRAERNSFQCEVACAGDIEVGDAGVPPCWASFSPDACDTCAKREKVNEQLGPALREMSQLRQKMQRAAASLVRAQVKGMA